MLYIYNECAEPQWELKRNKDQHRIQLIDNPKAYIDIAVNEDTKINTAAFKIINDMKHPTDVAVLNCKTAIRFGGRRLQPRIIESKNEYNCDFYIVSLDIADGDIRLINQRRKNIYPCFQYYDYDKKQLHAIFSVNKKISATNRCYMEYTLLDESAGNAILKNIMYSDRNDTLNIITRRNKIEAAKKLNRGDTGYIDLTDHSISKYTYPLSISIPMRPCRLVIIEKESDKAEFLKLAKNKYSMVEDQFEFICIETEENPRKTVKETVRRGYSACIYFNQEISDWDEFGEKYKEIIDKITNELYGKFFEYTLFMIGSGSIRRLFCN